MGQRHHKYLIDHFVFLQYQKNFPFIILGGVKTCTSLFSSMFGSQEAFFALVIAQPLRATICSFIVVDKGTVSEIVFIICDAFRTGLFGLSTNVANISSFIHYSVSAPLKLLFKVSCYLMAIL